MPYIFKYIIGIIWYLLKSEEKLAFIWRFAEIQRPEYGNM